ncbi:MAG: DUF3943 domain-containing protein [Herminiimonas sp.]|nr:DUF3943 domain-containing protein [Herminiimonas sp.]
MLGAHAQSVTTPQVPRVVPLEQSSSVPVRLPDLGDPAGPGMGRKDYVLPALEIIGFDTVLNRLNHRFIGGTTDYDVSVGSWRRNLHSSWVIDQDPFKVNQFLHPYQGAMYHGFARSAGMNYWESVGYTFAGSAFWEVFGETTRPSRNDQIASGIAGSFLGESLFRMANLVLEKQTNLPPVWREAAAAGISPATGFNRLAFGKRFDAVFASHDPAYYGRLQLGLSGASQTVQGPSSGIKRAEALANFAMDYGLPGKNGYSYDRPFDYFNFEVAASSANGIESITNRGLLIGREYESGKNYRGIYGLYGSYDYIAPQVFRVSSTALSFGTTGQIWLSKSIALQGTATTGIGYAAAGSVRTVGERDYNYGLAPQALIALRLTFDDTAALDFNVREYFVSRVAAAARGGHENVARADASLTVRVHKQHAVALKYLWSRRDASFPSTGDQTQSRGTIGLYYTLLGRDGFGAVDWR